jgi:hypothetical protein
MMPTPSKGGVLDSRGYSPELSPGFSVCTRVVSKFRVRNLSRVVKSEKEGAKLRKQTSSQTKGK